MRIRDVKLAEVIAGRNWRLKSSEPPSMVEWEIEDYSAFCPGDSVVYSALRVLRSGEVRPQLLIREFSSYEWWGDTCQYVGGVWRELERTDDPDEWNSESFVANPLNEDPSFMGEYSHEIQRAGFARWRDRLSNTGRGGRPDRYGATGPASPPSRSGSTVPGEQDPSVLVRQLRGRHRALKIKKLVREFADNVMAQTDAIFQAHAKGGDKHGKRYVRALNTLRALGDEGRDALVPLMFEGRGDVRVMAAAFLLRHRTADAVSVLRELAQGEGFVAFSAGEALKRWEEGTWALDPPDESE